MPRWETTDTAILNPILALDELPTSLDEVKAMGLSNALSRWTVEIDRRDGDKKVQYLLRVWEWSEKGSEFDENFQKTIRDTHENYGVDWPADVLEAAAPRDDESEDTDTEQDHTAIVAKAGQHAANQLASYIDYFAADLDGIRRSRAPQLTRDEIDMSLVDGINAATMTNLPAIIVGGGFAASAIPFLIREDVLLIGNGHSASYVTWVKAGGAGGKIAIGAKGAGLDPGAVLVTGDVGGQVDPDSVKEGIRRFSKKKVVFGLANITQWIADNL
jgi:hypothetical protein